MDGAYLLAETNGGAVENLALPSSPMSRRKLTKAQKVAKFESLDYDPIENQPYISHWHTKTKKQWEMLEVQKWVITFFVGLFTGLSAYLISTCVHQLAKLKFDATRHLLQDGQVMPAFGIFILFCTGFVAISTSLVNLVEPAATGSGIPEVKAYLNGVNVPNILRMKTLFVKFVGVIFSVAAGLFVGKEGPMVHTGSIIAAGISQGGSPTLHVDTHHLNTFRNDHDKRNFVSAGAAAGVAAAFGAPLGGILFSLEEASSFWNPELTWRTFFCSMVSTFTLNYFLSGMGGYFRTAGLITYEVVQQPGYHVVELIPFAIIGVIGGILGGAFNAINIRITEFRSTHLVGRPARRILEACIVGIATATVTFWLPFLFSCIDNTDGDNKTDYVRFTCKENQYNPMATMIFASQEDAIKHLFSRSNSDAYTLESLALYTVAVFFLAVVTYGIAVPSGLFVPSILIGSSYGRFFGRVLELMLPKYKNSISPGVYALIGASSMLGGCSRMTVSLTVIVLEITNDITFLLPIMLSIMIAKWVGDTVTEPLYDAHVRLKYIPFLESQLPWGVMGMRAKDVMRSPVTTVSSVEPVANIVRLLKSCTHNGFPVVNEHNLVCGLVLRSQLRVLLRRKIFQNDATVQDTAPHLNLFDFQRAVNKRESEARDLAAVSTEDYSKFINLQPYLSPHPYEVSLSCPLARLFGLFRSMGLRHLLVVDEQRKLCGIITRKDLIEEALEEKAGLHHGKTLRSHRWLASDMTKLAKRVGSSLGLNTTEEQQQQAQRQAVETDDENENQQFHPHPHTPQGDL